MTGRAPTWPGRVESALAAAARRPCPWLAAYALALIAQVSPWWYPTPDSVVYLSTARSLARTHELLALGSPQIGYPPGYALLLSPTFLLSDRPFLLLALLHVALALALLVGVYRWSRRVCPDAAVFVTGAVMLNVSLWTHLRRVLSEVPFMTGLVWSALLLDAALTADDDRPHRGRTLATVALVVGTTCIREVGLTLVIGTLAAAVLLSRRTRPLTARSHAVIVGCGVLGAVGIAGFAGYEAVMRATTATPLGTHLDGLQHVLSTPAPLLEGVRLRISEFGRLLIPGMFKSYAAAGDWFDINLAIYLPYATVLGVGWWRLLRRRVDVLALTLPPYVAVYIVWAFDSATRYLLPMLPVLAASVWYVIEPYRGARYTLFTLFLAAHLAVAAGYWLWVDAPRARACAQHWPAVTALAPHIRTSPDIATARGVPECARLMFEYELDRRVPAMIDAGTGGFMLITTRDVEVPGFTADTNAGGFRLLTRPPAR